MHRLIHVIILRHMHNVNHYPIIPFSYSESFNGDLSRWDVSKVTKMYGMVRHFVLTREVVCYAVILCMSTI